MQYIKFPSDDLLSISQETLDSLNLVPRTSVDGTETLMKCQHYVVLFPEKLVMTLAEDGETETIVYPYPVYEGDALTELLSSPEWSAEDNVVSALSSTNILDSPTVETRTTKSRKSTKSNTIL